MSSNNIHSIFKLEPGLNINDQFRMHNHMSVCLMVNLSCSRDKKSGNLLDVSDTLHDSRILEFLFLIQGPSWSLYTWPFRRKEMQLLISSSQRKTKPLHEDIYDPKPVFFSICFTPFILSSSFMSIWYNEEIKWVGSCILSVTWLWKRYSSQFLQV